MNVIEARNYGRTRKALMRDPVIRTMAEQLRTSGRPHSEFAHEDGTPRHEFMGRAIDGYQALCQQNNRERIGSHLGGPAEAILALAYPDGKTAATDPIPQYPADANGPAAPLAGTVAEPDEQTGAGS